MRTMNKAGSIRAAYFLNHSDWFIKGTTQMPSQENQRFVLVLLEKRLSIPTSDAKLIGIKLKASGSHLCQKL